MATLKDKYKNEIVPQLKEKLGLVNVMEVPRVTKITLNMGVGEATQDRKHIENAANDMTLIAGQKPVITRARQSNASFKIRDEQAIGCKVTLRGDQMFEFLDRLVTIALPRVRDFRGLNGRSFDGRGNFTFGVKEQVIFPEISLDEVKYFNGMDITIVTNAKTDEEAQALLEGFGFPFKKN